MTGSIEVALAGGVWVSGACHRDVELRPLTGADQLALMEDAASLPPAQWTTEALMRCLTRISSGERVTREAVRSLTVGDREALLLHLRRLTTGDRLPCVVTCPSAGCEHALEFELSVTDLLLPPAGAAGSRHALAIAEAGRRLRRPLPAPHRRRSGGRRPPRSHGPGGRRRAALAAVRGVDRS